MFDESALDDVAKLRVALQRFQDTAGLNSDWIWETDSEHRFVFVSDEIVTVSGRPASWFIGKTVAEVMDSSEDEEVSRHVADMAAHLPIRDFVYWIDRSFGRRCCSVSGSPLFTEDGKFAGYRGVGSDVTELKLAQERQQALLGELQHRLRNTMSIVAALFAQTVRHTEGREALEAGFLARLGAMGRAHALLDQTSWERVELASLLESEIEAHGASERLEWRGEKVLLGPASSVTFSLLFHELTTNSLKHGALSSATGVVDVQWHAPDATTGAEIKLLWQEKGGPPVSAPTNAGFGRQLLERVVSHQLSGKASLEFEPEGFRYLLQFRADALRR